MYKVTMWGCMYWAPIGQWGTVWLWILLVGDKLHLHFGHNWHPEGRLHWGPLGIVHTSTN